MQMASAVLCAFIHDGLPSFYNKQENCQLYFLCPLLTYLSKIAVVTCRTEAFLVGVGSGGWDLKQKCLLILSINLTFVFYHGMLLINLFTFEVNISFLLEVLNDYFFSFDFCCLFIFLWANTHDNNKIYFTFFFLQMNMLPRITVKITRPTLSTEV